MAPVIRERYSTWLTKRYGSRRRRKAVWAWLMEFYGLAPDSEHDASGYRLPT